MYESQKRIARRFKNMLSEVAPYVIKKRYQIPDWEFFRSPDFKSPQGKGEKVTVGFSWAPEPFPVWFKGIIKLPMVKEDERLYLELWFGGESLVVLDGKPYGEFNEFHKWLDVTPYADDKVHTIAVQTVPKGLLGKSIDCPTVTKSNVLIIDDPLSKVVNEIKIAIEVMEETNNDLLMKKLAKIIEKTFSMIKIPHDSDSYFNTALDNAMIAGSITEVWGAEDFPHSSSNFLGEEFRESILKAGEFLRKQIEGLNSMFFEPGELHVAGHAHIDYAWLWPVEETKRKIMRTFANVIRLAKKYPEFVFTQSSAQMYKDVKEICPELFGEIKKLVREGKWEPVGGIWVESDCNVPSVESLIRQFLLGQEFFEKEFGKRSKVCWLPDSFGFSWILPQIMKDAGIDFFVTTKLNWNEKNKFPYDTCVWRGLDGSEVLYHSFNNPGRGYNGVLDPANLLRTWGNYRDKAVSTKSLFTFGHGDGGGGPTDEMCENYSLLKNYPGIPKLKMNSIQGFFESLELDNQEVPVWDGELYLEYHRGTLTTQSRTKLFHKQAEDMLYKAECLSYIAFESDNYPAEKINKSWEKLLRNEFHDILPGSSVSVVYKDAERELQEVIQEMEELSDEALRLLSDKEEKYLSLLNIGSYNHKVVFKCDLNGKALETPDGKKLIAQKCHDGSWVYSLQGEIKPFSKLVLRVLDENIKVETPEIPKQVDDYLELENKVLKVLVFKDGKIQIYDKEHEREVFSEPANQLVLYKDIPVYWDAWDINYNYDKHGEEIKASDVKLIEFGPVRKVVRARYRIGNTEIIQDYILSENSRRLDIETHIDWHLRRIMLKALFPLNILSRTARYDLSAGYIERPTHRNTDYDKARFEVVAHRWVNVSEYDYSVSLINNGRYGHSCYNNILALTLLRSPVYPGFYADEGKHHFTYSVFPNGGTDLLPTLVEAENLNKPLILSRGSLVKFPSPFIEIDSKALKVLSIKRGEDSGMVLRVAEVLGSRGKASIKTAQPFDKVWKTNILEDKLKALEFVNETVEIDYEPFKIYTLIFEK